MPEPEVRFGILGLGMGHGRAKMAAQTSGARLTCVCDILEDKARAVAEELECDWCTDYGDMLARDDVDVIGVMTPSGMHADHGVLAAEAGKHVFTTKPMDIRVEKCDELIAACEQAGVLLAVDFGRRYADDTHRARMILRSGKLGPILLADVRMKWLREQSYYDGGSPPGWRKTLEYEGGSLANQGIHEVDLIYWLLGPVGSACGRIATLAHDIETEDMCNALLTFENGTWGVIQTTTCSRPDLGTVIELSGERGTLCLTGSAITRYEVADEPDASADDFVPDPDRPKNIIEDVVSAVARGTPLACDGHEGRHSTQILCAVYESARTGRPVALGR
ncbi:MAG: Gfo/Idh/MocA family protein [Armatimonadota bacterium]